MTWSETFRLHFAVLPVGDVFRAEVLQFGGELLLRGRGRCTLSLQCEHSLSTLLRERTTKQVLTTTEVDERGEWL